MTARQPVPISADSRHCPICGSAIRVAKKTVGYVTADVVTPVDYEFDPNILAPVDEETAAQLREQRVGKKTVAIVGMSPTSCSLAPFDEDGVDIWGLNEMHAFVWFKRATAWFQMHKPESFKRPVAKRNIYGHYDWLQKEHGTPIYMQYKYEEIPDSVEYPLREVTEKFFGHNLLKGDAKIKYFTSTMAYELALALYLGYERIEIYGVDMSGSDEFAPQKAGFEFWIGIALGKGVEIYLPPNCQLLWGPLYGYQGGGPANTIGLPFD